MVISVSNLTCDCRHLQEINIGESDFQGKLIWHASLYCSCCNKKQQLDGIGLPPEHIRHELINKYGLWCVILIPSFSKKNTIYSLSKTLHLDLKESLKLINNNKVIFMGTIFEAKWLVGKLGDDNATIMESNKKDDYKNYSYIFDKYN